MTGPDRELLLAAALREAALDAHMRPAEPAPGSPLGPRTPPPAPDDDSPPEAR